MERKYEDLREMEINLEVGERPEKALELAQDAGLDARYPYKLKCEDFNVFVVNKTGEWLIDQVDHLTNAEDDAADLEDDETDEPKTEKVEPPQ